MKALAYAHASEGKYSPEIEKLRRIERFGLEAVTGRRTFYFNEYSRLIVAENIAIAYQSRKHSTNWAQWAQDNPVLAKMLTDIEVSINAATDSNPV